ncbi:MAG: hypothetical protein JWQ35_1224 [Bacteriovoracaceae bacterium]|nr:hypothetical protein [Bacteriovoracaceae bacterium]
MMESKISNTIDTLNDLSDAEADKIEQALLSSTNKFVSRLKNYKWSLVLLGIAAFYFWKQRRRKTNLYG